jgi:glucokinase
VVADAAALLGRAIAGVHVAVGVERFLLVGGFAAAAGEPYRRLVVGAAAASCWDLGLAWDDAVSVHGTGDDLGLRGAWLTARDAGWV